MGDNNGLFLYVGPARLLLRCRGSASPSKRFVDSLLPTFIPNRPHFLRSYDRRRRVRNPSSCRNHPSLQEWVYVCVRVMCGRVCKGKGDGRCYARRDNEGWMVDEDIAGGRMLAVHPERTNERPFRTLRACVR